jgi:hypothetical protein
MEDTLTPVADTLAERIKKLLGQGLTGSVVAAAVGCDPSYISQLLDDEDFKRDVSILRASNAEGAVKRDRSWDQVEDMALDKAIQMLPLVSRPSDLVRLAAMANAAKRRATEFAGGSENAAPVVNLVLPHAASIHFQMNANSQVVEVDGRSMAALPTKHLADKLKERRDGREAAGVIDVMPALPNVQLQPAQVVSTERKKVASILENIGYADEPVPVPKVL